MFRRFLTSACLAYLLVAFGFILLAMLNASTLDNAVVIAAADARVIAVMSVIGLGVAFFLALRILIDGKRRRDLEQRVLAPRRKSDIAKPEVATDSRGQS